MEMIIHLHPEIFEIVKSGKKTIEARVNDEKRRTLKVGDTLRFLKRPDEVEQLLCKVTGLEYYNNFEEMVKNYEMKDLYLESYTKEEFIKLLEQFYTKEEQAEWGVVAIRFEKI